MDYYNESEDGYGYDGAGEFSDNSFHEAFDPEPVEPGTMDSETIELEIVEPSDHETIPVLRDPNSYIYENMVYDVTPALQELNLPTDLSVPQDVSHTLDILTQHDLSPQPRSRRNLTRLDYKELAKNGKGSN